MDSIANINLDCQRPAAGGIVRVYVSQRSRFGRQWYFSQPDSPFQLAVITGHSGTNNVWFDALYTRTSDASLTSELSSIPSRSYNVQLQFNIPRWAIDSRNVAEQLYAANDAIFIAQDGLGQFWLVGEYSGCNIAYIEQTNQRTGASEIRITATCRQRTPVRQVSEAYVQAYVVNSAPCACDFTLTEIATYTLDEVRGFSTVCAAPLGPYTPPALDTTIFGGFSNALVTDGVNDRWEAVNNAFTNDGSSDFSVNLWVYSSAAALTVISEKFFQSGGNNTGWAILNQASQRFTVDIYTGVGTAGRRVTSSVYTLNTWYMLTLARNGNTLRFYMNAVSQGTADVTGLNTSNTTPLTIGGRSTGGYFFNGRVDEYTKYNRVLTPTEITYLYNGGMGNSANSAMLPNLRLRYSFDALASSAYPSPTISDLSGNGNTLTGFNIVAYPLVPHL